MYTSQKVDTYMLDQWVENIINKFIIIIIIYNKLIGKKCVIEYGRNPNLARFERKRTMLQFAKDKRIMGKI
jgi:hypothetical protein